MPAGSGEDRLIAWLRRRLAHAGADVLGDDIVNIQKASYAVTVDHQIEGVHFPQGLDARWIARRLVAVNLSDLAAAGARPRYATLALAAAPDFNHRKFFDALLEACAAHGLQLIGGDLARTDRVHASLTLMGRPSANAKANARSNARPGDHLWLGGSVGEAALGQELLARGTTVTGRSIHLPHLPKTLRLSTTLTRAAKRAVRRHLLPSPQLELGTWLAKRKRAAVIDLSDGLSLDLSRLCTESGVGALLDFDAIPLAPHFDRLAAALKLSAHDLCLHGGEDYVLLFALPPKSTPPPRFQCTKIGKVTADTRLLLLENGQTKPLRVHGWDHLRSS